MARIVLGLGPMSAIILDVHATGKKMNTPTLRCQWDNHANPVIHAARRPRPRHRNPHTEEQKRERKNIEGSPMRVPNHTPTKNIEDGVGGGDGAHKLRRETKTKAIINLLPSELVESSWRKLFIAEPMEPPRAYMDCPWITSTWSSCGVGADLFRGQRQPEPRLQNIRGEKGCAQELVSLHSGGVNGDDRGSNRKYPLHHIVVKRWKKPPVVKSKLLCI